MDQAKKEPVKMYHPVEEKSSPYSLVEHATKSTDVPKTKPITSHSASFPPIPDKDPTLHKLIEPIPTKPPAYTFYPTHEISETPITTKPIPTKPPAYTFYPIHEVSETLIPTKAPPYTFYPIHEISEQKNESSASLLPSISSTLSEKLPYPPIPDKSPTLHDVLEPIPEESNNDLIENVKGQEKANEDVQEILAKKIDIDPTFVHNAQPIATNAKEARRMVNEDYKQRLEDAKNAYKEQGGRLYYEDSIKEYKKATQCLKYQKLLNSEDSKNLSDNEKEKIYKFYNKNFDDKILAKNKLRIEILRKKFNNYTF